MNSVVSVFYALKQELSDQGLKFRQEDLEQLPYSDLVLCVCGNAGAQACDITLVREEQYRRIINAIRDLRISPSNYLEFEDELEALGMWEDVVNHIIRHNAPLYPYSELSLPQKIWVVASCIQSHWWDTMSRVHMLYELSDQWYTSHFNVISEDPNFGYIKELHDLTIEKGPGIILNPTMIDVEEFCTYIKNYCELGMNPVEEKIVSSGMIKDYHCTHGCFPTAIKYCH